MNSCLYNCTVIHLRTKPKKNRFANKIFMFYLDLDEIDTLCKKHFILGHNRFRPYSFYDRDHMPLSKTTVRENVAEFLQSKGVVEPVGRIMILTNLRTLGYVFNPLSIYFCFDKNDQPLCSVPEIGNTFGEIKPYILKKESFSAGAFKQQQDKFFYISPFSPLEMTMEFNFKVPADRLDIHVDEKDGKEKIFYASLLGDRLELNKKNLFWLSLCFPMVTVKVIFLIHLHAFLLYLKKIPFHAKEENPHLQKEVLRAWAKN